MDYYLCSNCGFTGYEKEVRITKKKDWAQREVIDKIFCPNCTHEITIIQIEDEDIETYTKPKTIDLFTTA